LIDAKQLRAALGCFATGVVIVTTRNASLDPVGVTINSFSSVSLDPPLILFSIAMKANVLSSFRQSERFTINVLSHPQEALSNMFAKPSRVDWSAVGYLPGANGCAVFHDTLAQIECMKYAELDGGDHLIFLGLVTGFQAREIADPLLFFRGRYGTFARDLVGGLPTPDSSLNEFSVPGWG
jgi:flavin reductase (DIM6/NTAB) family NADH-FMN oxidoreductase RutF